MLAGFGHLPENSRVSEELFQPVRLVSVDIAKPWGREIWFTGMEARGESRVALPSGGEMPLSEYLAADPESTCGDQPVLLLKVLDPRPEPVLGDLYFEVHEEKREVYIVTAIGAHGGGIRFGMNQEARRRHASDDAFRAAYLEAVKRYENVRRRIDERGEQLEAEEATLREAMQSFTSYRTLSVGDVISVPTWTPHALQHGVRVVEFQTQTYERLIVSFAQQVVTQQHWDSERAIAGMHLDTPEEPNFEAVAPGIERIARFDHFNVWRADASAGGFDLPSELPYVVCMAVSGPVTIGNLELRHEEACFVPRAAIGQTRCQVGEGAHSVLAAPGL